MTPSIHWYAYPAWSPASSDRSEGATIDKYGKKHNVDNIAAAGAVDREF
jgi:hypothetical protein